MESPRLYRKSQNARCPYYRSEQREKVFRIRCDGIQRGTNVHILFPTLEWMIEHRDRHCKMNYKACPYYKAHNNI